MTDTRAPRRDATENRAALIAAAKLALNRDPDAALETIAAEAGLSRRAVYGHFATREELVREVVTLGAARVAATLDPVRHPDPLVRLALIGARLWGEVQDVRVMAVIAVRGPLADAVANALAPLRARVLDAVREGAASGVVRDDVAPQTLARLIEASAVAVLDEATRSALDPEAGHRLVMLSVLSTAGASWRDADRLIETTPDLAWRA